MFPDCHCAFCIVYSCNNKLQYITTMLSMCVYIFFHDTHKDSIYKILCTLNCLQGTHI